MLVHENPSADKLSGLLRDCTQLHLACHMRRGSTVFVRGNAPARARVVSAGAMRDALRAARKDNDVKAVVLTAADKLGALQAQLQAGGYSCSTALSRT